VATASHIWFTIDDIAPINPCSRCPKKLRPCPPKVTAHAHLAALIPNTAASLISFIDSILSARELNDKSS
jgi:hypothetical protein